MRPGFAIDLCENKPYGPNEGECWDLSKNSDVNELFEMIASEKPMIVTGSPFCTAFSQFQNASWYPKWEKWQATKLLHVALDVYEEQRGGRYFLHEHPLEASSWSDPRVISLQKRKGVFTASSPVCCFQAKIETKDGSRNVNRLVYKPTKWMTNSKVLAEALVKRCSNSNEPPFHRHIVLNGGLAKMATTYAHELVNTVVRGLRQQMLDDGWISEQELQFAGPSPSEPVFDLKDESATQCADDFDDLTGAQPPENRVHAGKMEEILGVKEIGLCKKISRAEAKRRGIAVVTTKWVVTDKGDANRPKVRCRLVERAAREDNGNLACA